ncbi:probable RNA annealing protein YRA2 [Zygosaccharomyces bailii ISA1307]|nr:probable RNA annealing protein YRA2 [Zygosaccharomyces bailii ISA1307]
MSVENALDKIVDEKKYRRRDLRNSLASRIGIEDRHSHNPPEPLKKRLRFVNVPLEISDYTMEDMVKEFAEPIYTNFYDHKDSRTAVFEFEDPAVMDKVVEKFDGTPLGSGNVTVEIFEQERRSDKRRRQRENRPGNHGARGTRGTRGTRGSHYKRQERHEERPTTEEDLNAELEEYMKSS